MRILTFAVLLTIATTSLSFESAENATTNEYSQSESATDSIEGLYYYNYDSKTKEETIIGTVPPELLAKIHDTLERSNGRGNITACSRSYKEKYMSRPQNDTIEQFVIDLRDPKMQEIIENNPDSLRIMMEEFCAEHGGRL